MPLYGDILRLNFFDLKNSINRLINGDLEPLKGFWIHFLGLYHPLIYKYRLKVKFWSSEMVKIGRGQQNYRRCRSRHRLQSFVMMKTKV